jgi:hypothetical protein
MADSFAGTGTINLQRGTSNVPYRFQVTVASSSRLNDGALPYASTLCSFTMLCHPVNSTVASTQIIVTKSQSSNQMILRLTWTTQVRPGIYNLEFKIVASINGSTITPIRRQFDFARVYLKERR